MKELWGETGQEKNTDVAEAETHNEDALMLQLTDFFMDLVHNIQSRYCPTYYLKFCIIHNPSL